MAKLTVESFLSNVENHTANILLDNGVYRHLRCSNGGKMNRHFDIVTYPGHLVISGDMGSYTFNRVNDMFKFFEGYEGKATHPGISAGYWSQKVEAQDRNSPVNEWSRNRFDEVIKEELESFKDNLVEHYESAVKLVNDHDDSAYICHSDLVKYKMAVDLIDDHETLEEYIEAFENEVVEHFDHVDAGDYYMELDGFSSDLHPEFKFEDMFERTFTEHNSHYLWCCHAIVWAIEQYNQQKAEIIDKAVNDFESSCGAKDNKQVV